LKEVRRILKPNGRFVINEPVRLLRLLVIARSLFPDRGNISEYEHPLTREEYAQLTNFFSLQQERAFRLPIVSLAIKLGFPPSYVHRLYRVDGWLLRHLPVLRSLAGVRVAALTLKPNV